MSEGTAEDLAKALANFKSEKGSIYDDFIGRYLSWYLLIHSKNGSIPQHEFTGILPYLTDYVAAAFERLHEERRAPYSFWRNEFQKVAGDEPPDLLNVGGNDVHRTLMVMHIARLLKAVTGEDLIVSKFEQYFFAQDNVLRQLMDVFLRKVYCKGLRALTVETDWSGYDAKIGSTELRCLETAGRVLFTLVRKGLGKKEKSVTLIGDASEENGVSFGIQSVHTDFFTACSLIRDVVDNWPNDPERQRRLVKRNSKISVG